MDFSSNRKALSRLWSCINSDYEVLLQSFMTQSGWTFAHFAKIAKEMQITLLYHASVGQARKRDEYHKRVGEMILNVAKDVWLHPGQLPRIQQEYTTFNNFIASTGLDLNELVNTPDADLAMLSPCSFTEEDAVGGGSGVGEKKDLESVDMESESGENTHTSTSCNDFQMVLYTEGAQSEGCASYNGSGSPPTACPEDEFQGQPDMKQKTADDFNGNEINLKYQLGAFYLTYVMYFRQPYAGLLKIKVDPKDLVEFEIFEAKMKAIPNKDLNTLFEFMFARLKINHAFETVVFADTFNIDPVTRSYLNAKRDESVEEAKAHRRVQDALSHDRAQADCQMEFGKYITIKQEVGSNFRRGDPPVQGSSSSSSSADITVPCKFQDLVVNSQTETDALLPVVDNEVDQKPPTLVEIVDSGRGVNDIIMIDSILTDMGNKPIFTHSALLGAPMTEKICMVEAKKRLDRLAMKHQKVEREANKDIPKPEKKPYKKEGGVFGRVKDDHLLDEGAPAKAPTRMKASQNLWNFIRGKGYIKEQFIAKEDDLDDEELILHDENSTTTAAKVGGGEEAAGAAGGGAVEVKEEVVDMMNMKVFDVLQMTEIGNVAPADPFPQMTLRKSARISSINNVEIKQEIPEASIVDDSMVKIEDLFGGGNGNGSFE